MNENILINNYKKRTQIFRSLMAVKFHTGGAKTQQELLRELKQLENQGQLRIYVPEKHNG